MFKTILIAVAAVNAIKIKQEETVVATEVPTTEVVATVIDTVTGDETVEAKVEKVREMLSGMDGADVLDMITEA